MKCLALLTLHENGEPRKFSESSSALSAIREASDVDVLSPVHRHQRCAGSTGSEYRVIRKPEARGGEGDPGAFPAMEVSAHAMLHSSQTYGLSSRR